MRGKMRAVWAVAAFVAAVAMAGCGGSVTGEGGAARTGGAAFPVTVTDDASRTVTFDSAAMRIVSLAPANTEIVAGLGLMDRLVGVTTFDDYPPEVKEIAKVGDFTTPNLEAIASAKPDLVLVTGGVQADVLEKLSGLDAKVLVIDPSSVEGVEAAIRTVASACGVEDRADDLVAEMEQRLERVKRAVAGRGVPSCFVEVGYDPLFTAGSGTLMDEMVRLAGGRNVVRTPGYVSYSVEQLLSDQPDFYLGTSSSLVETSAVASRPGYARLRAVETGKVAVLDDNLVSRPGPRIVDGVELIARAIHPDAF